MKDNLNEVMPSESPEDKSKRTGIPMYGQQKQQFICPKCGTVVDSHVSCGRPDCPVGKNIQLNS